MMKPPKDRNIPSGTSALRPQQPVLTPKVGPLKVGEQTSVQESPAQTSEPEQAKPDPKPRAGRSRGGRRPPPAAADAIPTTIRFDPEESSEIDQYVLELRNAAGRRALDKAEVFRELIRLAREHGPTQNALVRRLR
ncbi:hypothetical protein [Streptomyces sp. NPDC087300]|uniref:hypothetical protein n=1 Tax=Streptomyces sp. NPDC087300 TaxID=3365780 RepID=UPI0038033E48